MAQRKNFFLRTAVIGLLYAVMSLSINAQTRYLPTWESIDSRPTPQWFTDAKFGIFVCWGLYSVPAWSPKGQYSEWYMYWLKQKAFDGKVYDFHQNKYGPDILWADGEWEQTSEQWRTPELLAWLFNEGKNKEVVINDRWGNDSRHKHGGFYTTEYGPGMDNDAYVFKIEM